LSAHDGSKYLSSAIHTRPVYEIENLDATV